ncbi:hypothetical protein VCHA37P200_80078 [Vibrio chagasii]|nr:hypothetical protein VCHA31O71_10080 [Vibrio chagasii]CAH6834062.1 hypothetical protein VCHA35O137_10078 [Vibrio chagasii]CAH6860139.1 hypothetical protein VCHA36O163_10952 [Vibrio chagasii]CAH6862486.1 hypothetical protein VCHA32P90_11046 [Vibrio chagasii]CAH6911749.1 hypothetical protein VCHA49P380_100157 [Vibrio chagasii]
MSYISSLKFLRKTTVGNSANLTPKIFDIYKMTRNNLFIACNESTLILHEQLILNLFRYAKKYRLIRILNYKTLFISTLFIRSEISF